MQYTYYKTAQRCLIALGAILVLLASVTQAYVGPSCRSCLVTGDWASCTTCYSSKPGEHGELMRNRWDGKKEERNEITNV